MARRWIHRITLGIMILTLAGSILGMKVKSGYSASMPATTTGSSLTEGISPSVPPGIQILSYNATSLIFDLQPPALRVESVNLGNLACQNLVADGYVQDASPGEPGLVSAGMMIGIPPGAAPAIRILSLETVDLPGKVRLCPIASPIRQLDLNSPGPDIQREAYSENNLAYSQDAFGPGQPVEIISTGAIRSQHVANLRFTPFSYNPVRDKLRMVQKLTVEVQLETGGAAIDAAHPVDEGPFEPLLQKSLVNYSQARSWRTPPQHEDLPLTASPQDLPVYKIQVSQDGIYQVTYAALQSAGVPVSTLDSLDPQTFQVFNQGIEIPIYVPGEGDGKFDPLDYLLFYGQKKETKYSDVNVYWLSWGSNSGLRMAVLDGTTSTGTVPSSFKTTLHLEENHEYRSAFPSGPQIDHWYWSYMVAYTGPATRTYSFQLQNLAGGSLTASMRGLLRGMFASPQHHTRIYLNGHLIDDRFWLSTAELSFSADIPQSYLVAGTNTITVECPRDGGITVDQLLVNWFEIDYHHAYLAENNSLSFGGDQPGLWAFQVGGFTGNSINIFDITDPSNPIRVIEDNISSSGPPYEVIFEQPVSTEKQFLALTPASWLAPLSITADTPSTLKDSSNGADYIIISHSNFLSSIQPLAAYRTGQALRVKVVDVQDIYDEFNSGVISPQAIQAFLAYTYSQWIAPAPSYVLLVGDGHYDYKDHYGSSGINFIPPYLGEFDPWIGETASDNRYVTVSGNDILPDMYIGRLPVNDPAETTAMVSKIQAYEQNPIQGDWNTWLTFVADDADAGGDFPAFSNLIADNYLNPDSNVEKIYYGITHTTVPATSTAILDAINQGRLIISYTGHASTQLWAAEQFFNVNSIASLNNTGKYPFFIPMTCAEGYFIYPKAAGFNYPSLAESLVRADGKGAIASFSPTGFGLANGHDVLSQGLYQNMFSDGIAQFGPATTFAKYYLFTNSSGFRDLIDTYTLFGDPASRLKLSPTAVLLSSFTGEAVPGSVQLGWETANEFGIIGFNLYRSESVDGLKVKLNGDLIQPENRGNLVGAVYSYSDLVNPDKDYYYWLELVQIGGNDLVGPILIPPHFWIHLPLTRR